MVNKSSDTKELPVVYEPLSPEIAQDISADSDVIACWDWNEQHWEIVSIECPE